MTDYQPLSYNLEDISLYPKKPNRYHVNGLIPFLSDKDYPFASALFIHCQPV